MKTKEAVLVIDMINEFVTGNYASGGAKQVVKPIQRLLGAARKYHKQIIYLCDAHQPGDIETTLLGPHGMAGTPAAQIIPELAPAEGDAVMHKQTYSGFRGTDLHNYLQQQGIKKLNIVGVATHICVQHTVADAFLAGYKTVLAHDGVGTFDPSAQEPAINYMKTWYGADIKSVEDIIANFSVTKTLYGDDENE